MSGLARPLAEAAQRLFAQECSVEVVSRAQAWPQDLWRGFDDLGAARLLVPEARGGAGGDWHDACVLLECAGEYNLPLPIAENLLATWLLDQAGLPVPPGVLTLAFADDTKVAGGCTSLTLRDVPWAANCTHLVVAARHGGQSAVLCLPREAVVLTPGSTFSGEPRDTVVVADIDAALRSHPWRTIDTPTPIECRSRAALLRAALIAGACRRVLAMTLQHTTERIQFGRSLVQFQAVQHQLAQLAEEAAAARVAVLAAASTTEPRWSVAANAAAKVRAGDAAGLVVRISHQLHGAIGMTMEHALQQSTRRLLSWRDEHGSEAWWARELVAQFRAHATTGNSGLWPTVVAATTR